MQPKMHLLTAKRPSPQLVYNRQYACHQSVMESTGGKPALWVDLAGKSKPPLLRILSASHIEAPYGWELRGSRDYPIETIEKNDVLAFRITLNPTVKRNGKRFAIWSESQLSKEQAVQQWVDSRSTPNGFQLLQSNVLGLDWVQISQPRNFESRRSVIKFATATLTGTVQVSDSALFKNALLNGIGPQKAFGCGLLLIKRIR